MNMLLPYALGVCFVLGLGFMIFGAFFAPEGFEDEGGFHLEGQSAEEEHSHAPLWMDGAHKGV